MLINHLLTILLFLPLVGSLALLPLRNRDQHLLIRRISLAVGVIEFPAVVHSCLLHSSRLQRL